MGKESEEKEEIIAVVNENDKPMGTASAPEAHQQGLLHREASVYLINSQKEALLQQRKDNNLWDHSAAGHFSHTETYLEGAERELKEELGVETQEGELKEVGYERLNTIKGPRKKNFRFMRVYVLYRDIDAKEIVLGNDEVTQVKFFNKAELRELLRNPSALTQSGKKIIEKHILRLL